MTTCQVAVVAATAAYEIGVAVAGWVASAATARWCRAPMTPPPVAGDTSAAVMIGERPAEPSRRWTAIA